MATKILPPDPARLIEGLRDTGYEFNTALADVIDNSVDAMATMVRVNVRMDPDGEISVTVADNGCGMNEEELWNAMTYGARSRRDKKYLGKFGLGLKTASTAFCRRLSVVTRAAEDLPALKATWDLDHVAARGEWEVFLDKASKEEISLLDDAAKGKSGTLVIWESIDRLLKDYREPAGRQARRALEKIVEGFSDHAAMIYQRFLDPADQRARTIKLFVNDNEVEAWDPFCAWSQRTELVAEKTMTVELPSGGVSQFQVKAFVLPRREEFNGPEETKKARLENQNQGVYIYREDRLIHPADWLGMFSKEPHFSLLRVEFSFDYMLDEAFNVDIKKSRILLKPELYDWLLTNFLPAPRRAAEDRYRKGERKKAEEKAKSAHDESNRMISGKESELRTSQIKVTNERKGEAEVTNKQGTFKIVIPIVDPLKAGEVNVQPVPGIDDGLLWKPCLIAGHHGVQLNTGHPYYHKVYLPNLKSNVTVQGMDSLLWALAEAENGAIAEATIRHFSQLRFEVSRLLRSLVVDLPDPNLDDEGNQDQ